MGHGSRPAVGALLVAAGLWAAPAGLAAHDFWIQPSTFHPPPGGTVAVSLRMGEGIEGAPVPRLSSVIERFIVRQGGRDEAIDGLDRIDPAGWLRAEGAATAVIVYSSRPSYTEQPAPSFEAYLRHEGLDHVLATRRAGGAQGRPGRERFSRHAKALLTGRRTSPAVTRPVGLRYEIVPSADPTRMFGPLHGRVLYQGRPLAGVRVVATLHADPSVRLAGRTDAMGAFELALPRGGVWVVKSVHMVRASWFSGAEWRSLWASLVFDLPPA